jgi:hypothetical protein
MKERVAALRDGPLLSVSALWRPAVSAVGGSVMVAARSGGGSSRREGPSVGKLGLSKATPSRREKVPVTPEYVGIDLHRRRSVIIRMSPDGEHLSTVKIDNDAAALAAVIAEAGANPKVVVEATYGWVRHEAPFDRAGGRSPPSACRSRPLKLEAA